MNSGIYVFNTEFKKDKNYRKFKTFFLLPAGFRDLYILSKVNLKDTHIVYYDFNLQALEYKQWLFKFWDGEPESLYEKICNGDGYTLSDFGYSPKKEFQNLTLEEQYEHCWKVELEKWDSMEHFQTVFHRVKKHPNKDLVLLDITKDFGQLSNIVSSSIDPILFWYSNCFNYDPNPVGDQIEVLFKQVLEGTSKNITYEGV